MCYGSRSICANQARFAFILRTDSWYGPDAAGSSWFNVCPARRRTESRFASTARTAGTLIALGSIDGCWIRQRSGTSATTSTCTMRKSRDQRLRQLTDFWLHEDRFVVTRDPSRIDTRRREPRPIHQRIVGAIVGLIRSPEQGQPARVLPGRVLDQALVERGDHTLMVRRDQ